MRTNLPSPRLRAAVSAISVAAALLAGCDTPSRDETSRWTPERLYTEAKEEAASGNYEKAVKLYERLEGRAAGTILAQQAQIERAYYLWKSGEKAQALSTLERFIKLHPTSPALDYALYLQGLVNFNDNLGLLGSLASQDLSERDQQASRDSYQSFRQLTEQFPQSPYADDARVRMNYIVNSLAAYEVHVARYYLRRGAYVAAASRAQQAVQEFQRSPATEEALIILAQSYDKLGLVELRDDAERVLKTNYPTSTVNVDLMGRRKTPWWQLW
ncbi:MAG TPA: outer membrane protein assembly factor BamD [Caldimonas sp.]|nr:outer membrane protein assembly factor BamD [Caldimonas sp.]HEX4236205.1 outer membrane protein assembly factor BamD [Caldimonas sp.]